MIVVKLNGQIINMTESVSLETFLEQNNLANQSGVAVALNQSVIQKQNWSSRKLKNNDDILIITATQGG